MKAKTSLLIIFFLTTLNALVFSQDKTLSINQLIQIVREHHPIIQKAVLNVDRSEAEVLKAKSGFEPVLSTTFSEKRKEGIDYYSNLYPNLSIPTWFGIDVNAGLSDLSGSNVDPTQTFGQSNYLGVNIPLLKGLLMDKRRATLKQSKIFYEMSETEKTVVVNDILREAIEKYWDWVKAYEMKKVVLTMLELNQSKMDFVRKSFFNGEKAQIDTLESYTQLLFFQSKLMDAENKLFKSKMYLSLYCWKDGLPVDLDEDVVPDEAWKDFDKIDDSFLFDLVDSVNVNHPAIRLYDFKSDVLEIDKKLKFQQLLPKLDVYYNQLGKGYDLLGNIQKHNYFQDNYQYGVKLELPMMLMKGRADYRIAKLKIEQNNLDYTYKSQEVLVKFNALMNDYQTQKKQLSLQKNIYTNYQYLVEVERMKLENGESALFFVNSRENKSMEYLEKWIDVQVKLNQTRYNILWAAGQLK